METKSNEDWMVMVRDKCGFKHGIFVSSNDSSGGLAMLWKEEVKLHVQSFSLSHIDALVDDGTKIGKWHLMGFYGNPETSRRSESWAKLRQLRHTSTLPWLVIGDFNEIMGMLEKEGGSTRPRQQMDSFVETINRCGLRDIGFIGPKFTWLYESRDGLQIQERIDRALATIEWVNLFPMACLYHLTSIALDHSPLALHFVQRIRERRRKCLFRFESMWLKDPKCEEVVLKAWEEGLAVSTGFPLTSCLERCKLRLEAWNKGEFGHVGRKIAELKKHLEWLELQPTSPSIIGEMKKTRIELNCWQEKEDAMWYQRSKISWYQFGDRNTSYFHAKASARQKKNYMEGLMDDNG